MRIVREHQRVGPAREKFDYCWERCWSLLVADEVGYLPPSREDAGLLFRLVARRYQKALLIMTSYKSFVDWGAIFSDAVLATAILDRLLHHSTTIYIRCESYRPKSKRKAGVLNTQ